MLQTKIIDNLKQTVHLKDLSINNYKEMEQINQNIIKGKNEEIRRANLSAKAWMIGGVSVTVVATIILIFK